MVSHMGDAESRAPRESLRGPGGHSQPDPYAVPLDEIDVSDPDLFFADTHWGFFERLRKEDPVHYCERSEYGPYWSVTKYDDIVYVEKNPEIFSSDQIILLANPDPDSFVQNAGFITMDGQRHHDQRRVVQPVSAPRNLKTMEPVIREQATTILDGLPVGETFDWVDRVSIELTTNMLAMMFDYPWERRRELPFISDVATADAGRLEQMGLTREDREKTLLEALQTFLQLRDERRGATREQLDFVTALANADATSDLDLVTFMGTIGLLIIGGNDTTRNTITGSVVALNEYPNEYQKLRNDPKLIPSMVDEVIRWQTPLPYLRRTATCDTVLGGKEIKQGDKVVMWYVSANRDETAIDRAGEFLIDRRDSKRHLSFGIGVHFCMGSRIAELQLRVLWEEILRRFDRVEVVGEPVRVRSNTIRGYTELPVRVHA